MDLSKNQKSNFEKEQAISQQKLEFVNSQLSEAKILHEETLKSHNALMNAFKSIEEEHGNTKVQSNQQIEALKSDHI